MKKLPLDPFLTGIFFVMLLAWQFPEVASNGGTLPAKLLATIAVMGIFYIQGLSLNPEHLQHAAANWRLHILIQGFIFVGYPIVVKCLLLPPWGFAPVIETGIWLLAILPTTISTALVFTGKAGGNSAVALVNITLANFLGIVIVPAVMLFTAGGILQEDSNLREIFINLVKLLVVPFVIGQFNRRLLPVGFVKEHKIFKILSQVFILFILLNSFSNAFANEAFQVLNSQTFWKLFCFLIILLIVIRVISWYISCRIKKPEFRPAIFYCCSQKTLAAGLPLASTIFGADHPELGILLMPVLVYHPIQLAIDGILATRMGDAYKSSCPKE
jgi:sodium/bile acid cotransporter 7